MPNDWFYEPAGKELRLGDIVAGFTCVVPHLQPGSDASHDRVGELSNIQVVRECLAVVLTPCCSIEGHELVIGPLEHVCAAWFDNPFVSEDFVRIDRRMSNEQYTPPTEWARMDSIEKASRQAVGPGWAFVEYFAFPSGGLLPPYESTYKRRQYVTDCYVVDFRRPMLVDHEFPHAEGHTCGEKLLQLSPEARGLLRDKIANYYFRQPAENSSPFADSTRTVAVARQD